VQLTLSPVVADTPFRLSTAPADVFVHPGWQQARMAALALLGRGEPAVLLGAAGTGKTMLLLELADTLRRRGKSVRVVERGDALDSSLNADVLLIDEAGSLGAESLAVLCAGGVPFVLAALPAFEERLAALPREITPIFLDPLSPQDVARFVAGRLSASGRPRDLLEPDAVLALARHSAGRLRLVNVLAGAAVFLAKLEHAPHVGRRHVDEAAAMRGGTDAEEEAAPAPVVAVPLPPPVAPVNVEIAAPPRAPARQRAGLIAVAAAVGLLLVAGVVFSKRDRPPPAPIVAAAPTPQSAPAEAGVPAQRQSAPAEAGVPAQRQSAPAEAGVPAQPAPLAARRPDPALAEPQRPIGETPVAFSGVINNETMRQSGRLSLVIRRRQGMADAVTSRFHASAGLIGDGELEGHLTEDGRLTASGQLMMGQNPFMCELSGIVSGGRLVGTATFRRTGWGSAAHSNFVLTRP